MHVAVRGKRAPASRGVLGVSAGDALHSSMMSTSATGKPTELHGNFLCVL